MAKNKTFHKKKTLVVFLGCMFMLTVLIGRLVNLMVVQSEYYAKKAETLHEREREIKAERGKIIDAKGEVLADNKAVCTISVIHSQIKEPEKVIAMLTKGTWTLRGNSQKACGKAFFHRKNQDKCRERDGRPDSGIWSGWGKSR